MNPIIKAVDLKKRYTLGKNNHVDALRGTSLEIQPGEMTAIMGPSGSGKSTLMHLLGTLDRPDSGEIWLSDQRIDQLHNGDLTKIRSKELGFIFQGFNLIPTLTALENVSLAGEYNGQGRTKAKEAARGALDRVGLSDRTDHRPSELSGGQQQRVAIARAIVNQPHVVFGDEPTGDLDTATSEEIMKMMRDINQSSGTTFLLVTHNPEVAGACDRVVHMRDGLISDDVQN